jgi:hyperosmotically inducible periplasmic protein
MDNVSDGRITNTITGKLASRGLGSPCRVTVQSNHGLVTLAGTVEHAHQVAVAIGAARGMSGVRNVVNHITVRSQARQ